MHSILWDRDSNELVEAFVKPDGRFSVTKREPMSNRTSPMRFIRSVAHTYGAKRVSVIVGGKVAPLLTV